MKIGEMKIGSMEMMLMIGLVIVAIFFMSRCSMKCKCKSANKGGEHFDYSYPVGGGMVDDSAYSMPFSGGEILPGATSLPFFGGSIIPTGTYAYTGIGTF